MSKNRGYSNVTPLRRKLRKLNKHLDNGIKPALIESLTMVAETARGNVPKDTGDLAASIAIAVSGDGLSGVAGPAAKNAKVKKALSTGATSAFATRGGGTLSEGNKKKLFQFFKGYWIEFGTKGNAARNIPPMPARPFMQPAWDSNQGAIKSKMTAAINEQLRKASEL
jgi:hypothetical protein